MNNHIAFFISLFLSLTAGVKAQIKFEKKVIDPRFVSAGITAGDINKDGQTDIVAGDVWYEAPNWQRHEFRPLGTYYGTLVVDTKPRGSGAGYYSRSIGNYTKDIDGDGWLDIIVMNSQGAPCYWYRNPLGKPESERPEFWEEYLAIEMFHNESPQMVDLFGIGDPVILAGNHIGERNYTLSWFSIPEDPTQLWEPHVIGHPDNFDYEFTFRNNTTTFAPGGMGHGLGIGDMNKDGITDVLTSQGWYEGTADAMKKENWTFHALKINNLIEGEEQPNFRFAQVFADDFNRDGEMDFLGSDAHGYGLWWFEQVKEKDGSKSFTQHEIRMDMSQLHAVNGFDFDGDGIKEYVAGKRYLAHLGRDPGSSDPAVLTLIEHSKSTKKKPLVTASAIDEDSGAGTQIWIEDMNGDNKPDIITSNKKGTNLFIQK